MKILDACCGGKMFWYEKNLEFVDFQDNRELQTELCDLSPYKPIFGDKRAKTRWTVFVKNAALRKGEKE